MALIGLASADVYLHNMRGTWFSVVTLHLKIISDYSLPKVQITVSTRLIIIEIMVIDFSIPKIMTVVAITSAMILRRFSELSSN